MQDDNAALRKETHDLLAELEQLTLQMYEEHEAALTASREAQAAQRSGLEGLGETQRATFDAQQAQIDALGAVVRKQQGMIDEPNPTPNPTPTPNPNPNPNAYPNPNPNPNPYPSPNPHPSPNQA